MLAITCVRFRLTAFSKGDVEEGKEGNMEGKEGEEGKEEDSQKHI